MHSALKQKPEECTKVNHIRNSARSWVALVVAVLAAVFTPSNVPAGAREKPDRALPELAWHAVADHPLSRVEPAVAGGTTATPAGPEWAWNLPVYETSLDLATPHGKFCEFEQRLDALQDLGVGIIWFLPIFPTGGNPPDKPRSDSAYCVRDYYDVNPRHGTKEEFKHLVAAIHAHGMRVIMDWVPNHIFVGQRADPGASGVLSEGQGRPNCATSSDLARCRQARLLQPRPLGVHVSGPQILDRRTSMSDGFREDVAGPYRWNTGNGCAPKLNALKPVFMLAEADEPGCIRSLT